MKKYRLNTLAVHGGQTPDPSELSVGLPIHRTSAFAYKSAAHAKALFDLNEAGNGLDMGKGKNVALGRLREATDLNVPGQPFAMAMFPGRLAKIKVTQRPGTEPDQVYNDVRGVTKAG